MTLLMVEGFDHIEIISQTFAIALQDKWNLEEAASGDPASLAFESSIVPIGRGNSCFFSDGSDHIRFGFNENLSITSMTSGVVGFHFYYTSISADYKFLTGQRSETEDQWSVWVTTNGKLKVYRGGLSFTQLGVSSPVLQSDTWHFIEVTYFTADSILDDSFLVHVDGVQVINLIAGSDTKALSTDVVAYLKWGGSDTGSVYVDDVYLLSLTGHDSWNQSRRLGPSYVQTLFANADGTVGNNFTGSDEDQTDNYLHIDEVISDEDASFNKHPKSDGLDFYNHPEMGNILSQINNINKIYGVQVTSRVRTNDAAGNLFWQNSLRVSGSTYDFESVALTNTTYEFFTDLTEVNPGDNQLWSTGVLNRAEFGVHLTFI